jgi:hypothetical protein
VSPARKEMKLEDFKLFFKYENGKLFRLKNRGKDVYKETGSYEKKGYLSTFFNGKYYKVHRVIYLLNHGYCPEFVDHINGKKDDNRIENLREADISNNHYNCKIPVHNTTGVKGIHKANNLKSYVCRINYRGKRHNLGRFKTLEEAKEFTELARELCHGQFANHGIGA